MCSSQVVSQRPHVAVELASHNDLTFQSTQLASDLQFWDSANSGDGPPGLTPCVNDSTVVLRIRRSGTPSALRSPLRNTGLNFLLLANSCIRSSYRAILKAGAMFTSPPQRCPLARSIASRQSGYLRQQHATAMPLGLLALQPPARLMSICYLTSFLVSFMLPLAVPSSEWGNVGARGVQPVPKCNR